MLLADHPELFYWDPQDQADLLKQVLLQNAMVL